MGGYEIIEEETIVTVPGKDPVRKYHRIVRELSPQEMHQRIEEQNPEQKPLDMFKGIDQLLVRLFGR